MKKARNWQEIKKGRKPNEDKVIFLLEYGWQDETIASYLECFTISITTIRLKQRIIKNEWQEFY